MPRKKQTKYIVQGAGGAVWELDELSPSMEDRIARGGLILIDAPLAEKPAKAAEDAPEQPADEGDAED